MSVSAWKDGTVADAIASTPMPVVAHVETWACSVPLDAPLSFGAFEVREREYTVLRLTSVDGDTADIVALSRRSPIDVAITDVLSSVVLGEAAAEPAELIHAVRRATTALERDGVIGRATSLLECALWDLRAKAAGEPLWRLLGGVAADMPVMLVEGYALPGESDSGFVDRLAARVDEGYRALKLEGASYADPAVLAHRLRTLRSVIGDDVRLAVDVAWSWSSLERAVRTADLWSSARLAWLEDPFERTRLDDVRVLRRRGGVPIGVGDEATRPDDLHRLLAADALDVLRLDAMTIGGIDAFRELAAAAASRGIEVSAHVHPEVHRHLALACEKFRMIEAFPLDRPFDRAHLLIERPFLNDVHGGIASTPWAPGTGVSLNIEGVQRFAYRSGSRELSAS